MKKKFLIIEATSAIIPVLFLIGIYYPTESFFANQYDDTYITYRYAINLAQGNGLVFNVGEKTDSASSFFYTIILAGIYWIGLQDLELVGASLGLISLLGIVILVYKTCLHITNSASVSCFVGIVCGINGFFSGWTLSGMETMLWVFLVMLTIYLIVIRANYIWVVLAIAAAAFTRFEGMLLIGTYGLAVLSSTRPPPHKDYKYPFIALSLLCLVLAIFYVVKHEYYAVWISHAFEMKQIAKYYQPRPRETVFLWVVFGSIPFILSIPTLLSRKYFFVGAYFFVAAVAVLIGLKSDWSRYSIHLIPIVYTFASPALSQLFRKKMALALSITITMTCQAMAGTYYNYKNMTSLAAPQSCRKQVGQYLNEHIPTVEYIASSDIGAIAYEAIHHRFVDLTGLTSVSVLREYQRALPADNVLKERKVRYLADTFSNNDDERIANVLKNYPSIKVESNYISEVDELSVICRTNDRLIFTIAKIKEKPRVD